MTTTPKRDGAPLVHNGTYTVSNEERGHYTVKLYTQIKGQLAGKRILSLPDPKNPQRFESVAFWDDANHRANVWRRFRGPDSTFPVDGFHWQKTGWSTVEQRLEIWCDLATRGDGSGPPVEGYPCEGQSLPLRGHWAGHGYRLLLEGRCVICNRPLTDPESIRAGIGPTCAART